MVFKCVFSSNYVVTNNILLFDKCTLLLQIICCIAVDMHIVENKSKSGKKIYRSILLRESYREDGKVKKRTIANLSNCTPQEIRAIKLALDHKDYPGESGSLSESIELQEGLSVGA